MKISQLEFPHGLFLAPMAGVTDVPFRALCKKYGARICVDTDAHFTNTLGRAYKTLEMLEDIDFPDKLIVNTSVENLKAYFDEKNISY